MPQQNIEQLRTERIRGYIIKLVYGERPLPLEADVLQSVLDGMNYSDNRQDLAQNLDYLRSEDLIYVFRPNDNELSRADASRLVQAYARGNASEMLCKLTSKGVRWYEGTDHSELAVARI